MMRVFLSGASGNVGRTIVRYLRQSSDLELVGGWCMEAGEDLGTLSGEAPLGVLATDRLLEGLRSTSPDLVIDFSSSRVIEENIGFYLDEGLDSLIGTTGLPGESLAALPKLVKERGIRMAVIPNYGLGVNLVMDFVRRVRQYYPYIDIVDQHHEGMGNAPSGTAAAIAAAAGMPSGEIKSAETFPSVLGAEICGARVHSQRLPWPAPFSGHEITLGRKDEIIRIAISDFTSDIYLDGLLLTARRLPSLPPGSLVQDLSEIL